jgi:hypothetical protein
LSSQIPLPRKGPGRPTYLDIAGCNPQQAKIQIGNLNINTLQISPTLIEDKIDIADPIEEPLDK